jgi:NADPH:quinone reductase-like Zn-dependent oxidoreductase
MVRKSMSSLLDVLGGDVYSFSQGIKRMTNGRGVDVVLDSLAGEALRRT